MNFNLCCLCSAGQHTMVERDLRIQNPSSYKSSDTWEVQGSSSAASRLNTCRVITVLKIWHSQSPSLNPSYLSCWGSVPGHPRALLTPSGRYSLNTVLLTWVTRNYLNKTCSFCSKKYRKLSNDRMQNILHVYNSWSIHISEIQYNHHEFITSCQRCNHLIRFYRKKIQRAVGNDFISEKIHHSSIYNGLANKLQ